MGRPAAGATAAAAAARRRLAALLTAPALLGLGVDNEAVARFARWVADAGRRASVWTRRELAHAAAADDPAAALCASFCCKEAVYKAAGGGVRFSAVELLAPGHPAIVAVDLAPGTVALPGVAGAVARLAALPGGELLVVAALHDAPAPAPASGAWPWEVALERVPLDGSAGEIDGLLASAFDDAERRALAGRPATTVLGRLAAKRAILRALGPAAAGAAPADVRIERERGKPPRIAAGAPPGAVLFSISHTRTAACAVAARAGCAPAAGGVESAP